MKGTKMIEITWSWWSFFAGGLATVTLGFWLLVSVALKQWSKKNSAKKNSDANWDEVIRNLGNDMGGPESGPRKS
jgi:hypothetical protein